MKLAEFKKQRGMTDEELLALVGDCSLSALRKWLSGERIPRKDQMEQIFAATGGEVRPDDFYDLSPASSEVA